MTQSVPSGAATISRGEPPAREGSIEATVNCVKAWVTGSNEPIFLLR